MLSILLVPIIVASLVFPRWVYLSMLTIAMVVTVAAALIAAPEPPKEAIAIIVTSIGAGGFVAEAAYRLARARTKAVLQLEASEKRFRALIENSSDICVVINPLGKILYVSPSVQRILGYRPDEVMGRQAIDFVHTGDQGLLISDMSDAMAGKYPEGVSELRFQRKDGSWLVTEIARGEFLQERDEPGLIVNARDITRRKKVEAELRSSAQFNQEIISNAGQGIIVFDRDMKCVVWNHFMESLTGVKAEQALGTIALGAFHSNMKSEIYELLHKALAGETFTTPDASYSQHTTDKLNVWMSSTYAPHRNGDGEIIGVIGIIRDVTERVQAEERAARMHAETADALARERRYNEITRLFSNSLNLSEALRTVTRITSELLEADGAIISLLNEEGELIISSESYKPPVDLALTIVPKGAGISWRVIETGEPMLVRDYAASPEKRDEFVQAGVRSCLVTPISAGGLKLGVMSIFSTTPARQFDERDLALVDTVGRQAGLAIQRVRLIDDAQRRAQEAETLREAGAAVTSTLRLHETFERILQQLARVVSYDSASVQLLKDGYSEIVDVHGWSDPAQVIGVRFSIPGDNPNTAVIQERHPVILREVDFGCLPVAGAIRSWLGVPLMIHDEVIGMLALDSLKPGHFIPEHARLAGAFADQVAVAIENAGLFERAQHLARTDDLTGLNNRRRFFELAERAFNAARDGQYGLSILMIDIDRFKRVNDTYGHVTGDEVLQEVAQRCRRALRGGDILARYGGEEFVALLPSVTIADARTVAERLRQSIVNDCIMTSVDKLCIAVSVGISYCADTSDPLETLLVHADQALYAAKHAGGNCVMMWNPEHARV